MAPSEPLDRSITGPVSIDDVAWVTANVFGDAPLAEVRVFHNDPATGLRCRNSGSHLGRHTLVSRAPLTLDPSLACDACSWHGHIRDGHWVPA